MNFIILFLLLYNKNSTLPQSFCEQALFLLVLLFVSSSNSSYLTNDITLAPNNINNTQKHTMTNPSFNNKSNKKINSTEANKTSQKRPQPIPFYKPYFPAKNTSSNSGVTKASNTQNVTYDLKHKEPYTLNSSKKSNITNPLNHSKNNKKSDIIKEKDIKKIPDIISNKDTMKSSNNSTINNSSSTIVHRTISDSNISASSFENTSECNKNLVIKDTKLNISSTNKNTHNIDKKKIKTTNTVNRKNTKSTNIPIIKTINKKINAIPNLINAKYCGATISVIISGLGIITGKVLSNYNNILALKLENDVIVYINNDFVLNFF